MARATRRKTSRSRGRTRARKKAGTTRKARRRLNRQRWRAVQSRHKRNSTDYRKFKRARSRTYGPVSFAKQPSWVRRLGRKQRAKTRSTRSRSYSRKATRSTSRSRRRASSSGRVVSYAQIMKLLRRGDKAWVCAGKRRTGCGGGRRGYRGSRQLGVIRP